MALKLHIHEDDYTLIQEKVAICMESSIGIKFVKLRAYFWHGARSAWFFEESGPWAFMKLGFEVAARRSALRFPLGPDGGAFVEF